MVFNKIAIIGVGLLGASFALAAKRHGISKAVYGYGRSEANLKKAKERGIIDEYSTTLEDLCRGADLIVLASPVGTFLKLAESFSGLLNKGAIVTDVGSVKGSLVYKLEAIMPEDIYFVGGHPIKGDDRSGNDASSETFFENADFILTPTEKTNKSALNTVTKIWQIFGTRIKILTPELHDRVFSSVSHLPHIVAYALVNTVNEIDDSFLSYSGAGFMDTTRIAMSSPEIWRDICILNRENILDNIDALKEKLDVLAKYMRSKNEPPLYEEFDKAKVLRKALVNNKKDAC